jgi:hypothetical protein
MNAPCHKAEEPHRDTHTATPGATDGEKWQGEELGQMNVGHEATAGPTLMIAYCDEPGS